MNSRITLTVLLVFAVAVACVGREPTGPETGGVRLTDVHTLGEPVVVANLTVWPVFTDDPVDLGKFTTLSDALKGGTAEVREVGGGGQAQTLNARDGNDVIEDVNGDEPPQQTAVITDGGATVGTLVIENKGDVPLLVCAGTIVKGGNQDRQIGEDIIIEAKATVPVEAFCVEQGRWSAQRMGAVTDGKFEVASMNAVKGVREKGQYEKKQDGVWNEVAYVKLKWLKAFKSVDSAATPQAPNARLVRGTTSLAVVLDANEEVSGKEIETLRNQVRAHFAKYGNAVGFAYAVDGKVVTVRAFLNDEVFAKQFDPFLTSMVAEAWIAGQANKDETAVAGKAADVVALVKAIEVASEKTAKTRGSNLNGIRANDAGYNGNCYLPVKGRQVAVTRDWTSK